MEGWQAKPDGVVLPTGTDCVCITAATTPRLRRTPPQRGIGKVGFNWQDRRGNAGKTAAKRQAFTPTPNPFLVFFCVLCVRPRITCPRIACPKPQKNAIQHSPINRSRQITSPRQQHAIFCHLIQALHFLLFVNYFTLQTGKPPFCKVGTLYATSWL